MNLNELKQNIDLLDYIKNSGFSIKKVGTNKYWVNPCPVCGHFGHFTVYTDTNSYSSFNGCCNGGTIIDYFMEVEDMSKIESIEKLKKMSGGDNITMNENIKIENSADSKSEDIAALVEVAKSNGCSYYQERGLSEQIISKYKLGYLPDGCKFGKDYKYVLPVSNKHIIVRSDNENIKERYKNLGSTEIFNISYFEDPSLTGRQIFITEGIFDALSLEEMGFFAVAINSTTMVKKLIDILNKNKAKLKDKLLIIAFDNDQSGIDTAAKLKKNLIKIDLCYTELNINGYKDVNQFFIEDSESLKNVIEDLNLAGTTYEYMLESFKFEQEKRAIEPYVKTGLNKLDSVLGGGMYPGFYVLGSVPSLGKSALALQIADKVAEQGHRVLFFSLEMSRYEMTCRSLARMIYEHQGNSNITTNHILQASYQGSTIDSMSCYIDAYKKYLEVVAKKITMVEGGFDMDVKKIKQAVEKYILKTGEKPVVFVDYLQILKPSGERMSDKQNIDITVVELKRISRDLDLPVVAVSSFNRTNYQCAVSFEAFKESGSIEYTADVVLGLQLRKDNHDDINEAKNSDPRPLELVILKNRRGKAFEIIALDYKPKQNYFQEVF